MRCTSDCLQIRGGSIPRLPPVPTPLAVLTSNPPTSHGGFEETRKTVLNVFHPRSQNSLPCHNRGCYSHNNTTMIQLTSQSLPGSHGTTNNNFLTLLYNFLCHNRGWHFLRHNIGWKLNYSPTSLPASTLLRQRARGRVHNQPRCSHHPLGPPTMWPL